MTPGGEAIYAWQEFGADGRWGTIASIIPAISSQPVPLVFRDLNTVKKVRKLAEMHAKSSGHQVRLRRFTHDETFEEVVL